MLQSSDLTRAQLETLIKKKKNKFLNIEATAVKRKVLLEEKAILGKAAADDESIPEIKSRSQMLYEDAASLIVPRLKITSPDKSKRYITMQTYLQKQKDAVQRRKKALAEKQLDHEFDV